MVSFCSASSTVSKCSYDSYLRVRQVPLLDALGQPQSDQEAKEYDKYLNHILGPMGYLDSSFRCSMDCTKSMDLLVFTHEYSGGFFDPARHSKSYCTEVFDHVLLRIALLQCQYAKSTNAQKDVSSTVLKEKSKTSC